MMINIFGLKINLKMMFTFILMKFNFDKIDKNKINLIVFDDLVFSDT